jgi:hypothetical protein
VAAGILALCAIGVGAGVHAALGDGDGPAIQLANRGVDLRPEADGGDADALGDGSAAGSPDDGAPPASDDPGAQAPRSTAPADPPASGVPTPGTPPSTRPGVPPTTPPTGATNPYLDPADPRYVPAAERVAWLEGEQRIRQCMADAGLVYLEWEWWQGGTPMPDGLDESAETAWMLALRGDEGSAGCAVEAGDAPKPPSGMERPGNTSPPPVPPPPSASPDEGAEQAPEQQLAPDAAEPEASAG